MLASTKRRFKTFSISQRHSVVYFDNVAMGVHTFRNQSDDQQHDSTEDQCAKEQRRSRKTVDQQPGDKICCNFNGC